MISWSRIKKVSNKWLWYKSELYVIKTWRKRLYLLSWNQKMCNEQQLFGLHIVRHYAAQEPAYDALADEVEVVSNIT